MLSWINTSPKTAVALLALTLASGGLLVSEDEIRLRARGQAVVNDIEAQLNGDFRSRPSRQRLEGELQNINLDVGTPISFCLVSGGESTLVATAHVEREGGKAAEFKLDTDDGDTVPSVMAGDQLEAHEGWDDCTESTLLVSATFQVRR